MKREKIYNQIDVKSYIWKDVVGYEGIYKVSSGGHVINLKRMVLVAVYKCQLGYLNICLNGKKKMHHRIIAEAFILNPDNKSEVNHLNGIRDDNRIENLEWCTRSENVRHSFEFLGRVSNFKGKKWTHKRKETKYDIKDIHKMFLEGYSNKDVIEKHHVKKSYIHKLRFDFKKTLENSVKNH